MSLEDRVHTALKESRHLLGRPPDQTIGLGERIQLGSIQRDIGILRDPVKEIVVVRALIQTGARFHGVSPQPLVQYLSVLARAYPFDQHLLDDEERQGAFEPPADQSLMHDESRRDIVDDLQDRVGR